jgi:hypothetical protein
MEFENKKLRDVADIAARIMMGEKALHPNQQKLDVHEPEKDELTAKDFEKLRAGKKAEVKKEDVEVDEAYDVGRIKSTLNAKPGSKRPDSKSFVTHSTSLVRSTSSPGETVSKLTSSTRKLPEDVEQIEELKKSTMGSYVKKASKDLHNTSFDHGEDEHRQYGEPDGPFGDPDAEETMKKRERDIENRQKGINRAATKLSKEEVDAAAEFVLEYESKDGKFVHRARPGVYGGTKDEKHAVDTLAGPKTKELKAIESEKKKKMSEMVATYKEQGLKGLFEALKKEEVIVEEPTSAEFDAQLADAKQRAAGTKKQPEVSKPAVQAVQNEATHTTVEFIDYNDVNGVKISEIDLEERSLSEPEMEKKEQIVKSMKKGISGFKARYGKDAKSVMYATATKRAMGEKVEQIEEGTPDGYQNRDGRLIPKIHPTMTPHEHGHDYTTQSIEDAQSKSEIHSQHREILKDNPHPTGSKEHKDWEAGANKAKADHLKDFR